MLAITPEKAEDRHLGRAHSKAYQGASTSAIQHHYDVGNQFYQLWLDPALTYSCALWKSSLNGKNDEQTLEQAQQAKIDYHIQEARAAQADRVLEIGCGWGSTLMRLVSTHGAKHAIGLTLSEAQRNWILEKQIPNADVRLENWYDHQPHRRYDAIISIAAFEAFARHGQTEAQKIDAYRTFFERCHSWLKPSKYLSIQTIIYENFDSTAGNPFVNEIFPESDLPRLSEIAMASKRLFEITKLRNDREHYTRTLRAWHANLRENRAEAVDLVGEAVVEQYEKYLGIFTIGFHRGTVNLTRVTMRRL